MIDVKNKAECTGCSACESICPKQCITMTEDREGFDYPLVDSEMCVNCHLCEKICPVNRQINHQFDNYTVCIQNNDEIIRSKSSAGGSIGAIYSIVFDQHGIVFGVGFDEGNVARFMSAENMEECFSKKLLASKYVAAELDGVFSKVKTELESGRLVCFVGLPCQVAGLNAYLDHKPDNLWLIDLVCYGVPSRKLYRKYLQFLELTYKEKILDVRFRDKSFGYSAPTMCIELKNGKVKSQNCAVKSYLRCFFNDISSRPSCYECPFKSVDRISDITIGDMRSVYKFVPDMDDDLGTTVVYVHSARGERIMGMLDGKVKWSPIPLESVLKTSGKKMISCPKPNPQRESFFSEIDAMSYDSLVKKYCPPNASEHITNLMKNLLLITRLNRSFIIRMIKRR